MTQTEIEKNIKKILTIYKNKQKRLWKLANAINQKTWKNKEILDSFLDELWLEKNKETRFIAFSRIWDLNESPLKIFIEKNEIEDKKAEELLNKSYDFVQKHHLNIHEKIIKEIETQKLLPAFYLELLKWVHNIWEVFWDFYKAWNNHIINGINKDLKKDFQNNTETIIKFLSENKLFDKDEQGKLTEKCYTALVWKNKKYKSEPYIKIFKKEISEIISRLENLIKKLSKLEDETYNQKQEYLNYLESIKEAFGETQKEKLIWKWKKVDENWMAITTPFQIVHPLEYYDDKYRRSVSPEWDLRIRNKNSLDTSIYDDILNMFNWFYEDIWKDSFKTAYNFSISNLEKIQLYISSPVLYYGVFLTWIYSAQVVPNDEDISEKYGKKIFAFPKHDLKTMRESPFMRLSKETIEKRILHKYRKFLFWEDKNFHTIYEIETIGHELGHILWKAPNLEWEMNKKTWQFKNIEEFKATTWWLVAYFLSGKEILKKELITAHIIRCISLLKYRNISDIEPYYSESLIHLEVLFKSKAVYVKKDKIYMYLSDKNYENIKKCYIETYTKLIYCYLNKFDAGEFLFEYVEKHSDWYLIPKNPELAKFVEYYYELYKQIWNEVDEITDKKVYTWEKKGILDRLLG